MFFRAGKEHKAASRTSAAAGTPDLIVTDYVIPPSGTIPELRSRMEFFVCLCKISRTYRAVISADRVDRLHIFQFFQTIDIPLQDLSHS